MNAEKRRGMGRPKMRPGEARTIMFSIRVSEAERAVIEAAAEREGVPASDWARDILIAAARIL